MNKRFKRGDAHPSNPRLIFWVMRDVKEEWCSPESFDNRKKTAKKLFRLWEIKNRNRRRLSKRVWARINPEGNKLRCAKWRTENPERTKAGFNKWKSHNKKHYNKYQRDYRRNRSRTDPLFRLKSRMRTQVYDALSKFKTFNRPRTFKITGCSAIELKIYLEKQFKDGMNWSDRNKIHIDHRTPLATAKTRQQTLKLFHYTNLQPLWAKDNLSKGSKY